MNCLSGITLCIRGAWQQCRMGAVEAYIIYKTVFSYFKLVYMCILSIFHNNKNALAANLYFGGKVAKLWLAVRKGSFDAFQSDEDTAHLVQSPNICCCLMVVLVH